MKKPTGRTVHSYRMLAGILAVLLLTLPASAATWKTKAPMPSGALRQQLKQSTGLSTSRGATSKELQPCRHSIRRRTLGLLWQICPFLCGMGTVLE